MPFESFQSNEANIEKHDALELKMGIQRAFLGLRYAPDESEQMVNWLKQNGGELSDAIDQVAKDYSEGLEQAWNQNPDLILEKLAIIMDVNKEYREAA